MSYVVNRDDLLEQFGLSGVTYYPRYEGSALNSRQAEFLSSVGLPNTRQFDTQSSAGDADRYPVELGARPDVSGRECAPEQRSWAFLGYLVHTRIALDPETGEVHALYEGEEEWKLLNRSVETFSFTLWRFQKLSDAYDEDEDNPPTDEFREAVNEVDDVALADPDSEWNRFLDEMEEGMW